MTDYSKRKAVSYVAKRFTKWMANPYYSLSNGLKDESNASVIAGPLLRNTVALSIFELAKTAVTGKPPEFSLYQPIVFAEGCAEGIGVLGGIIAVGNARGSLKKFWANTKEYAKIDKSK